MVKVLKSESDLLNMTESKISPFRDFPIQQVVIEVRVSEILKSKSSVRFDFYGWVEDLIWSLENYLFESLEWFYTAPGKIILYIYWLIY